MRATLREIRSSMDKPPRQFVLRSRLQESDSSASMRLVKTDATEHLTKEVQENGISCRPNECRAEFKTLETTVKYETHLSTL